MAPATLGNVARSAARWVWPRQRRWQRLLASLTLDPDRLTRPLPEPGPRDFIICGSPRTGTALLAAMLHQPPEVVTVMEPWDAMRLAPAELFRSLREEIAGGELRRGRLDVPAMRESRRVVWCRDGERPHTIDVNDRYLLGVKLPAFWRYLDLLPNTKFLVCLRNPVETVTSYRLAGGRTAHGFDYAAPFNERMNRELEAVTDDPAVRRVLLYDYIATRILPHLDQPNVLPVRYERWFEEAESLREEIGAFLGVDLGEPPIDLEPGGGAIHATNEDVAVTRAYCTTAEPLGYDLSSSVRGTS